MLWLKTSGAEASTVPERRFVALEVGGEHLDARVLGAGRGPLRTVAAKWAAPPSRRSSRATAVSTT